MGRLTVESLPREVTERFGVLRRPPRPADRPPDVEHVVRDGWVFGDAARLVARTGAAHIYLVPASRAVRPPVATVPHLELWMVLRGDDVVMASGKRFEPELLSDDGWTATLGDFFAGVVPDGVHSVEVELDGEVHVVAVNENFWHAPRPADPGGYPSAVRPVRE